MRAMRSAVRAASVWLGVVALAGDAGGQDKAVRVLEPTQRRALVIGNAAYAENRLANPEGDAKLIGETLEGLGFDEVVIETNLETKGAMLRAVREFGGKLGANDLAFFYYSGHGQQAVGGDRQETLNYLLPTGYDWGTPLAEVEFEALSFERVRRVLEGAQLRVMVLDACRKYKQGKSGGGGGLAPTVAARGELIAYATEADAVATDEGAGAGIYAQELARALGLRGVEVADMFQTVMERVEARTKGAQHPEYTPKIAGRLYLNGEPTEVQPGWIRDWEAVKDETDPAVVEGYIQKYESEEAAEIWVTKAKELLAELTEPLEESWITDWETIKGIEDPEGVPTVRTYIEKYKGNPAAEIWVTKAKELLARLEKEWVNSSGMEFVRIEAGSFEMGSPEGEAGRDGDERQHEVRISQPFYLGKYEVTQGEWQAVMGSNPSVFHGCGARCPVDSVSWEDAQEFIRRLNKLESGQGYRYRLPMEAEWEYAARATTRGATPEGELGLVGENDAPVLAGQAWYGGNSGVGYAGGLGCSDWPEKQYAADVCGPHPVGQKRANPWGLHDMLGNVWEWVGDWYGEYPSGTVTDSRGSGPGSKRVARGGSWHSIARQVRSAYRYDSSPGRRYIDMGFRLVRMARTE